MKTKILLFILFGALVLVGCEKEPPPPDTSTVVMPPLTHQGLNTFGCYINGELFVANDGDSYWDFPPISGSFDEETKRLNLLSKRYINADTEESDDVSFRSYIINGVGEYEFQYNEDGGTVGYRNWMGNKCDYNYRDYPGFDVGRLTITYLNEEKNIIAGTFYINLTNKYCTEGDTIMKITNGRFDFKY